MEKEKSPFALISADLQQALNKWNQVQERVGIEDPKPAGHSSESLRSGPFQTEQELQELQLLLKELQKKMNELTT